MVNWPSGCYTKLWTSLWALEKSITKNVNNMAQLWFCPGIQQSSDWWMSSEKKTIIEEKKKKLYEM